MVTLHNDFHNTTTKVRAGRLSPATARRAEKALCGMSDCSCSGPLGTRGTQEAKIVEVSQGVYEVEKAMKKYNCFWRNCSADMVDFHRALEPQIAAGIVNRDDTDSDGTAFIVSAEFSETFEKLADEFGIDC